MSYLLDAVAITVTGLMIGNELAIAIFIHPAINRLDDLVHAASAREVARVLGRYMPFWYASGLIAILYELWARRTQSLTFELLSVSALLWAAVIAFTVTMLVPLNNRIAAIDPQNTYPTWLKDRAQWDARHRVRVIILAISFLLLLFGVIVPIR